MNYKLKKIRLWLSGEGLKYQAEAAHCVCTIRDKKWLSHFVPSLLLSKIATPVPSCAACTQLIGPRTVCYRKVNPKHYYCSCHTNVQRIWWLLMPSLTILWRGLCFLKAQNGRGIYLRIRKSCQPIPVNHKLTCLRTGLLSSLSGQRSF